MAKKHERKRPTKRAIKKQFGLPEDMPYVVPNVGTDMQNIKDESIMLFSYSKMKGKGYRLFYGIGVVARVVKGDKQDLIYINFGFFREMKKRLVVAYDNIARRQTLTLKRGQVCQVYGIARFYKVDVNLNGTPANGLRLGLYAKAINGWYVPTMMDIRKLPPNEDLVEPTEKEKELQKTFEDVLDDFLNSDGEEDEYGEI